MFGSVGDVQIINCKYLNVRRNTFFDVNDLQRLVFTNIEELVLDDNAFSMRSGRNLRALEFKNVCVLLNFDKTLMFIPFIPGQN
jgi:hypothetical protein